ncbi:MAG: NUDIX domain-containing protein [Bacilli bacterium]|nr:NUDIX domain-containing protein [Bacilli bacterium]
MEYLDLYDEKGNLIGEKILRTKGMKPQDDKYIKIVLVFIKNDENKFLMQKTSKEKGSVWATTGGLVSSGYTPDETVVKEIEEELGLVIEFKELKHIETIKRKHVFQDTYYLEKNINIEDLKIQEEEVEFVKWLSVGEINELIKNGEFREGNILAFNNLLEKEKLI